jgi:TonB-dependent receptor
MRPLLALMLGTWVLASRAQNSGPASDPQLAARMIDIAAHHSRPLSLAEVFTLVEIETGMNVTYPPGSIVLGDEVVLAKAEKIPLSQLLASVAAQRSLVFERRDGELQVRSANAPAPVVMEPRPRPAAAVRSKAPSPAPAPVIRVAPASASVPAAGSAPRATGADQDGVIGDLAARIERISSGRGTRSRKEKDIAAAVRAAIAEVHLSAERKEQVLELAVDLVQAAAGVAPQFTETIANAAAFAPAVAGPKSAGARLRAAAYAGMRAPQLRRDRLERGDLPVERAVVIKAPAGQTPETFVVPGSEPVSEAAPARESDDVAAAVRRISSLADSVQADAPAVASTPAADGIERADAAAVPAERRTITIGGGPLRSERAESAAAGTVGEGITPFTAPALELPAGAAPAGAPAADNSVVQMEALSVQAGVLRNSQTSLRERASVSVDVVTSPDFRRFIATDVSDIVIRMPGLSTTTKGSFAVVRGLAERYNPIMLDGMVLPSSDPERQTPELDLFPTRLVDAVVVNKMFEPRLPGTSSGGAIDLRTKTLPEGRYGQFTFGFRADEGAVKRDDFFGSRTEGNRDMFALGTKDRASVPASDAGNIALVRSNDTPWSGRSRAFPVGLRFGAVYENRVDLGGEGRALGYSLSLGYDSSASTEQTETFGFTFLPLGTKGLLAADGKTLAGDPKGETISEFEREVRIGGLATIGYAFNANHSIGLSLFLSQIGADNVTRTYQGFSGLQVPTLEQLNLLRDAFATGKISSQFKGLGGEDTLARSESGYYRERNLTDLKLSGEHKLSSARVEWALADIRTSQDEPDATFLPYQQRFPSVTGQKSLFIEYGQPGRNPSRYWREVSESTRAGRLDGQIDFDLGLADAIRLRSGIYIDETERSFLQESFYLSAGPRSTGNTLEELIADVRKAPFDPGAGTQRVLNTTPAFANAERKQAAAYLSFNLPLVAEQQWARKLDLLVGARMERFQLDASGRGQLFNERSADFFLSALDQQLVEPADYGTDKSANRVFARALEEDTLHPAAALTWSPISRMNVRLGYSRTVARPSFREVGPYFTNDEVTNEVQHGNVFLRTSQVDNYDFRIEYFLPKRRDLIALSLFAKRIANPIEKVKVVTSGVGTPVIGWFNNPGDANIRGGEFEAAKNLGFLGELGSWFTLGGNATFIDARVPVGRKELGFAAGEERQLFDQPEWIANAYLTFDHQPSGFSTTLSWFSISDVLRNIDTFTWNTYVAGYSRLDLTLSQRFGRQWQVRVQARNLADPPREFIADPEVATDGVVLRTFKDGRNYSLSASYDF